VQQGGSAVGSNDRRRRVRRVGRGVVASLLQPAGEARAAHTMWAQGGAWSRIRYTRGAGGARSGAARFSFALCCRRTDVFGSPDCWRRSNPYVHHRGTASIFQIKQADVVGPAPTQPPRQSKLHALSRSPWRTRRNPATPSSPLRSHAPIPCRLPVDRRKKGFKRAARV
jgi:hypothetical protein